MPLVDYVLAQVYITHRSTIHHPYSRYLPANRENVVFLMDYQMGDFDPYAEPKLDFEQADSPPAPRPRGAPRPEEVKPRGEFQDFDPRLTLSYNGLLPTFLGGRRLRVISDTLKGLTEFSWCDLPPTNDRISLMSLSRGCDTYNIVCSTRVPSRPVHPEEEVRHACVSVASPCPE